MKITFIKTCFVFCAVVLLGSNFIACKKITTNHEATAFSDDAKEWFTSTVVKDESNMLAKPYTELPKDAPSRVFARMEKLEALLNWSESKSYTVDKLQLLIVPVKEAIVTLENKVVAKRCIVFYREQNGSIEMNVIEKFIQKKSYNESNPDFWETSFLNYFYKGNSRLENCNADICIYDKGYQFKAGFTVKNGAWKASGVRAIIGKVSNVESNFIENNQVATTVNSDCQLWGVWLVYYDENGNEIDRTLLYTYCVYNEGFEPPYGGGGSTQAAEILPDRQKDWEVDRASSGIWAVISTEQFKGIIDPQTLGKQFTGINHLGDNGVANIEGLNVIWVRQGATTTVENIWVAKSFISGKLTVTYTGNQSIDQNDLRNDIFISNNRTWAVTQIWP